MPKVNSSINYDKFIDNHKRSILINAEFKMLLIKYNINSVAGKFRCLGLVVKTISYAMYLFAIMLSSTVAATEFSKLRVASFISPLSPQNSEVIKPWIEKLQHLSNGELVMDFFPGGTLGRHGNYQLKLLRDGVQDVSLIVPGYTPGQFPDNDLFELPLLMNNTLEASLTYYRMIDRGHLRGYEDTKLVSVFMSQPYFIHLNTRYENIEDLKGKKIRVAGYMQSDIIRRLGATPIGGIPVTQIRESISRGLIDGTILGWDSMHVFGVKYVTNYHIEIPVTYTPILLLMNLERFNSLPAKQKALIEQYSGEGMARDFSTATSALAVKTYMEAKAKDKQFFISPSNENISQWRQLLSPIEDHWTTQNPAGVIRMKAFKGILAEVRQELSAEKKP
ncbi:MAG: TRAP-type C4-dicarboxylate transport system substrate-binding protein [Kiritimatiellia bacterium]|jgi:TRAP-type C4-dicarboxylate transport system substrate-binding protein